jgi:hypothetical protein
MKQKIIAQLKAYLKTLGVKNLSTQRIDAIADKLALKITDETTIDVRLEELNEVLPFADIAKDDDRLRTLEAKSKDPKPKDTPPVDTPPVDTPPAVPDDAPPYMKQFLEMNKTLLEKINKLEAGNTQATQTSRLVAILKEKNVPEGYYKSAIKGRTFKDDAEIEAFATELVTDFTEYNQGVTNTALIDLGKPIIAVAADKGKEVSPEMKAHLEAKSKERQQQQPVKAA